MHMDLFCQDDQNIFMMGSKQLKQMDLIIKQLDLDACMKQMVH